MTQFVSDRQIDPMISNDPEAPPPAAASWEPFARNHSEWLSEFGREGEPLEALSLSIIYQLHRLRPMTESALRAELALEQLCRGSASIGFLDGVPISYPYVALRLPPPPQERRQARSALPPRKKAAGRKGKQSPRRRPVEDEVVVRLRGYVGWLVTDPGFREARDSIERQWRSIGSAARPPFPLRRDSHFSDPGSESAASTARADDFATTLAAFCDRWGLLGLASWNLPIPRRPEAPYPLAPGAAAPPGVFLYIPLHYPLAGGDDLVREIRRHQRELAERAGMAPSAVGLANHRAYARIFEVAYWERVIRSRHTPARSARDVVRPMERSIARELGIRTSQVRKLRNAASACLRGKRDRFPALRTRS